MAGSNTEPDAPQCLLQDWLGQHVVLQSKEDTLLGNLGDAIVHTSELHDEHLHTSLDAQ